MLLDVTSVDSLKIHEISCLSRTSGHGMYATRGSRTSIRGKSGGKIATIAANQGLSLVVHEKRRRVVDVVSKDNETNL